MKPINEVYSSNHWEWDDYQPLLESFGYPILVQENEDNYQGDSWLLLYNEGQFGFLQFGWGSCSGCDALQACQSLTEVAALRDELHGQIQWFPDAQAALTFAETHDWQGDWSGHSDECKQFVERATEYLKSKIE